MALEALELVLVSCPLTGPLCPQGAAGTEGGQCPGAFWQVPWVPPCHGFPCSQHYCSVGPSSGVPKGFCSLMDAWSTSHCVSQVLPRPGSGCAVQVAPVWVWDALWGAPETVGGSGSDTSEGSEGLTATVPAGAQGSVSTCPQSSPPTMPSSSSLCWPTSAWPPSWTQAYSHEVSLAPAGKSCLLALFLRGKGDFWVPKGWRGTFLLGSAPHVGCLGLRQCQDSRAGPSLHLGIPGCPRAG